MTLRSKHCCRPSSHPSWLPPCGDQVRGFGPPATWGTINFSAILCGLVSSASGVLVGSAVRQGLLRHGGRLCSVATPRWVRPAIGGARWPYCARHPREAGDRWVVIYRSLGTHLSRFPWIVLVLPCANRHDRTADRFRGSGGTAGTLAGASSESESGVQRLFELRCRAWATIPPPTSSWA